MKLQQHGTWRLPLCPTAMKHAHAVALATSLAMTLATSAAVAAAEPTRPHAPARDAQIYQQRLPDGRVVLTDTPTQGAMVQRTWDVTREDPVAAARRSEQVRQEARAVSERIERRIERQQAQLEQSESDRLRARLAELRREQEADRQTAARSAVVYAPPPMTTSTHSRVAPGAIEWSAPRRGTSHASPAPQTSRMPPASRTPEASRAPYTPRVGSTPAERSTPPKNQRRPVEPS